MSKYCLVLLCTILIGIPSAYSQAKFTTHQITKGESLYSLAKKYHCTIGEIARLNNTKPDAMKMKIGQKIKVPTSVTTSKVETKKVETVTPLKETPHKVETTTKEHGSTASFHTVAKGETIYSIAKLHGFKTAQLLQANNLKPDTKLKIGQRINLPTQDPQAMYIKPAVEHSIPAPMPKDDKVEIEQKKYIPADDKPLVEKKPEPVKKEEDSFVVKDGKVINIPAPKEKRKVEIPQLPAEARVENSNITPSNYEAAFTANATDKKKIVYRGIGTFLSSENPGNQYLALYNYADMGTILKVTNLMSKQSIYVKVIGKVPSADAQNEIILKVSSQAAEHLQVKEDKFLVEVTGYN